MDEERDNTDQIKAEFFTLGGAVAAGGFSVGVGEKIYRYIKSKEPIVVQIMDSVLIDESHRVAINVANQTIHGVYIEMLQLEKPKDAELEYFQWKKDFGHGGVGLPPTVWDAYEWTPKHIPPGEDIYFAIGFPMIKDSKTPDKEYGEFKMSFSRLEEKKMDSEKYSFRIRF